MSNSLSNELKQRSLDHLRWFIAHAPMQGYGPRDGPFWMSSLSLAFGRAVGPERPAGIVKRCYRSIESPWGSNLYSYFWRLNKLTIYKSLAKNLT